jgi:hypothetical protein
MQHPTPQGQSGMGVRPAPLKKCHIRCRNAARMSHLARICKYSNVLGINSLP